VPRFTCRMVAAQDLRGESFRVDDKPPLRYRDGVDVRLFGPGERVVFLPYSRASFESTQRWIHERDIFETVGAGTYEAAVIT
jgi:hypothetical protein